MIVYQATLAPAADMSWTAALAFAVCACLRLARFNVARGQPVAGKAHFVGVPAPMGAMLGLLPLAITFSGLGVAAPHPAFVGLWLVCVGALMVCRLPTFSPKTIRVSRTGAGWLLVAAPLVAGLALSRFWELIVLLDLAYFGLLAWTAATMRRRRDALPAGE